MSTFYLKRGDLLPVIETVLRNEDGTPVDLTGATVRLLLRNFDGGYASLSVVAELVTDGTDGRVRYTWQTGDTDVAGDYEAEWRALYNGTTPLTIPSKETLVVSILPSIQEAPA